MSLDLEQLSIDDKYRIFEALSHPTRVRILELVAEKELAFSALKRELGLESSGQLQHHLQKLSGLIITQKESGCYGLTSTGRRALDIYRLSETSGRSLEAVCCLPIALEGSKTMRVGRTGRVLRLSLAGVLLVLTAALLTSYSASGEAALRFYGSSISVGFGLSGTLIIGFFGVSFLIAGLEGDPGCEVTAIPNLFTRKRKHYCACLITPFNLPNGRLLEPLKPS
jgi:DNA-binding transcriptional ArsR family regulator